MKYPELYRKGDNVKIIGQPIGLKNCPVGKIGKIVQVYSDRAIVRYSHDGEYYSELFYRFSSLELFWKEIILPKELFEI